MGPTSREDLPQNEQVVTRRPRNPPGGLRPEPDPPPPLPPGGTFDPPPEPLLPVPPPPPLPVRCPVAMKRLPAFFVLRPEDGPAPHRVRVASCDGNSCARRAL